MTHLPALPHGCNSYVVVETVTGQSVLEMFEDDHRLPFLKTERFHLVPTIDWLAALNAKIKSENTQ
jgi:hypothetical protein